MERNVRALCVKVISLLKQERERRKLSKYYVAQESGLSPQMVAYVENGDRNPTLETVLRMAKGLDVDLAKIINRARKAAGVVADLAARGRAACGIVRAVTALVGGRAHERAAVVLGHARLPGGQAALVVAGKARPRAA